jgi:phytoene synthase
MSVPQAVAASYRFCRDMARRSRSSFYASFLLLPRAKQQAMCALYAFMRHTDDLGDSELPADVRAESLSRWRTQFAEALAGRLQPHASAKQAIGENHPDHRGLALLPALADTVARYRIPPEHLEAVIDGQVMDLRPARYETFDELVVYCQKVASAVGLACLHVWGFRDPAALVPAEKCGIAFQLTNILRDLEEDLGRGRIYLPLEDLRACDYRPEDLFARQADGRFLRLVALEVERTRALYDEAAQLAHWLEPEGQRIFGMMNAVYRRLLEKVQLQAPQLLEQRVRLGGFEKLAIGLRWFLLPLPREARP